MTTRVTLLAGGVGGAKLAEGLYALPDVELTVIGNVADDEAFHGLWVSPDVDTLTYSLSGKINRAQGWGVEDEGTRALATLAELGEPTWMTLGDRDLGLHIYRTMRRSRGDRPSVIARDVARAFGITCDIVLPTDDVVQTRLRTADGWLSFQEYFVRERHAPLVKEVAYTGASDARMTNESAAALAGADLILFAPSNPILSIGPILAVPGLRAALTQSSARKIAVSPLIGGAAVKGPAVEMMRTSRLPATAAGVAEYYSGLIDQFVIDRSDAGLLGEISGVAVHFEDIMMRDAADKVRLARVVLQLADTEVAA